MYNTLTSGGRRGERGPVTSQGQIKDTFKNEIIKHMHAYLFFNNGLGCPIEENIEMGLKLWLIKVKICTLWYLLLHFKIAIIFALRNQTYSTQIIFIYGTTFVYVT